MGAMSFVNVGTAARAGALGPSADTATTRGTAASAARPARAADWMRMSGDCSVWGGRRGLDPPAPATRTPRARAAGVLSAREWSDRVRDRDFRARSARARRSDARDRPRVVLEDVGREGDRARLGGAVAVVARGAAGRSRGRTRRRQAARAGDRDRPA